MPTTSSITPAYLGTYSNTGVYRVSLASLGLKTIQSIMIRDDSQISGGTGAASGFDLDFVKLSYTNTTTLSQISDLAGEPVFDFSNGVRFQRGFEQTWSSFDNSAWNRPYLFGTDSAGNYLANVATLGALDAFGGSEQGNISLGEGGYIILTLSQPISTEGLYLYYGDGGGGNDGSSVVFSDSKSPATNGGVTLVGTTGDDEIILGTGFNATLGKGNDRISGSSGNDRIDGAAGNDVLFGDSGNDTLLGSAGHDRLTGGQGNDTLDGGDGRDTADYSDKAAEVSVTLASATQVDVTVGGSVEDTLANIENVIGGSGNDTITGDGNNNVLRGGLGIDILNGAGGVDTADFSDRSETVRVNLGGATPVTAFVGGVAEDQLVNFENLIGGSAGDKLTGNGVANILSGGAGKDALAGRGGNDTLLGGGGNDSLAGEVGKDRLDGGTGNDLLVGGDGVDRLIGGSGADILRGGRNRDILTGGADRDVFVFDTAPDRDTITDFRSGTDVIRLSLRDFSGIGHTGALAEGEFYAAAGATSAHDASDHIIYNTATGVLYYDADGKGGVGAIAFAQIGVDQHQALAFNDFQIVA